MQDPVPGTTGNTKMNKTNAFSNSGHTLKSQYSK